MSDVRIIVVKINDSYYYRKYTEEGFPSDKIIKQISDNTYFVRNNTILLDKNLPYYNELISFLTPVLRKENYKNLPRFPVRTTKKYTLFFIKNV